MRRLPHGIAVAQEALSRAACLRVTDKLRVQWFEDGALRTAEPRDDKYEGAWLVSGSRWEQYYRWDLVLGMVQQAQGFPFAQFEES